MAITERLPPVAIIPGSGSVQAETARTEGNDLEQPARIVPMRKGVVAVFVRCPIEAF